MIRLTDLLITESKASEEAKLKGLTYMKFGRWGKDGKVTHTTDNDRLVAIEPDTPETPTPPAEAPKRHYTHTEMASVIKKSPEARIRALRILMALDVKTRNKHGQDRDTYRGPQAGAFRSSAREKRVWWMQSFLRQVEMGRNLSEKQHRALEQILQWYTKVLSDVANGVIPNPLKQKEREQAQATAPIKPAPTKENPSFDELRQAARKHRYTVMTRQPLEVIQSKNPVNKEINSVGKPDGFWFGMKAEWVNWTEEEMPEWKGDNLYSVDVDTSQCIMIEDVYQLREFNNKYQDIYGMINWDKVARDAKGVIFLNYFPEYRTRYKWYYGWDVASGCVWDASAIRQVEQVSI